MHQFFKASWLLPLVLLSACSSSDKSTTMANMEASDPMTDPLVEQPLTTPTTPATPSTLMDPASSSDTSAIAGLWNDTEIDESSGLEDVVYIRITATGEFSIIDYFGDEFDNLGDCYLVSEQTITNLGNDRYEIVDDEDIFVFTAVVNDEGNLRLTNETDDFTGILPPLSFDLPDPLPLCEPSIQ